MIQFPTLYSRNAKGDIIQWSVASDGDLVVTRYGKQDGKQVTSKDRAKPTNVGRANARSAEEQADFEANAAWVAKKKEGYFETVAEAVSTEVLIPMKAKRLDAKAKSKIVWPLVTVQRKLNGLRCTAHVTAEGVTLKSYGQEIWSIPHIEAAVWRFAPAGSILDGEIYIHGIPLQTLNSWVKNEARPERLALEYHLYDVPRCPVYTNAEWTTRHAMLERLFIEATLSNALSSSLKLVETIKDVDESRIKELEKIAIEGGYEGLILRYTDGAYGWDTRSSRVLKWKNFIDREFIVEDITSLEYNVNGVVRTVADCCICRNDLNGTTFKAKPKGTLDVKEEYWRNRHAYIGKPLVVRFLELSVDGTPQGNPVGHAFRLEEDMPKPDDEDPWRS